MMRRLIAAGLGALFLIILVVAVRGCLDSRKKESLKDYNERAGAILQESDREVGKPFFDLMGKAGESSSTDLQASVASYRAAADRNLKQAQKLDVPDQMAPAQRSLVIALEFRKDALEAIARLIPGVKASAEESQQDAVKGIAGQMQAFLASDVILLQRVSPLIKKALDDNKIGGQTIYKTTRFLNDFDWLDTGTVAQRLGSDVAPSGNQGSTNREPAPGLHGHELESVTAGGVTLQPGGNNRVKASSDLSFDVKFKNSGENDEVDVRVVVRIEGAGKPIRLQETVDSVPKGTEATASIPLDQAPPIGEAVTVSVEVRPVPGEEKTDNNKSEYPTIFTR